ncbi:MAG: hypothetical protein F4Z75_08795, partial [Synechococcus sp. SB0668_bin_15]|nr:hypothetical protein [Synechococcus sp. SB0668_bin_15]
DTSIRSKPEKDKGLLLSDYKSKIGKLAEDEEERKIIVERRIGQDVLREYLIKSREQCSLTGIKNPKLLRASHIKPWAKFEDIRLDPDNCLLLSASWDAAFDQGLITFNQDGTLHPSRHIIEDLDKIGPYSNSISFDHVNDINKHLEYLKWHRENIFISSRDKS